MEGRRSHKQSKGREMPFKSSPVQCASWSMANVVGVASELVLGVHFTEDDQRAVSIEQKCSYLISSKHSPGS